jgi:hypothetical protein
VGGQEEEEFPMRRGCLVLLLAAVLLPFGQLYGQQCITASPVTCAPQDGGCVAKVPFGDSAIQFKATGTCTVNAAACTFPPSKFNLAAEDLGANLQSGALTQTVCGLYVSRNKCVEYEITHQPINSSDCSNIELTIFAQLREAGASSRICQCEDLRQCLRGSETPTAGVSGFWPRGTDPISRKVGGTSHFWWCQQPAGVGNQACFGGYELGGSEPTVGSSFPIKFILRDCDLPSIAVTDAQVLLSIQLIDPCATFCPVNLAFPGSSEEDNPPPLYRLAGGHYQFNWVPEQAGLYEVTSIFLNYDLPPQSTLVMVR